MMEAEAEHANRLMQYADIFQRHAPRCVPDVIGYAYAARGNVHIPARRMTLCRWVERSWSTDYGTNHRVREALNAAAIATNNGFDMRDWDDPVAYQRRRRWIEEF
ncbi:hypothetical protein [Bifidobacterium biavatii]|uniref:hypothetical protein n=1 Tax=Bifidobacterium biavatii TaxID=762212 RepID=UPI00126A2889|nr:hypothetical protein [Bifidobacterium biavatii]